MRSQRRSQFEHDHRRRADRAPENTASFTRDRRRAHWHIMGEALTGPNRCRNGRESAVCEASGRDKAVRAVRLNYSLCPEINVVDGLQSCQCPNPHYIFGQGGTRRVICNL